MLDRRLEMIFVSSRLALLHGPHVRRRADFTRLSHHADFRRGFDQALLVEQKSQIGKVSRRAAPERTNLRI